MVITCNCIRCVTSHPEFFACHAGSDHITCLFVAIQVSVRIPACSMELLCMFTHLAFLGTWSGH
jgi:hypothetical protein